VCIPSLHKVEIEAIRKSLFEVHKDPCCEFLE